MSCSMRRLGSALRPVRPMHSQRAAPLVIRDSTVCVLGRPRWCGEHPRSMSGAVGNFLQRRASADTEQRRTEREAMALPGASTSDKTYKQLLIDPATSYADALQAYEALYARRVPLQERHFLALMEKASVEHRFQSVRAHFDEFCGALGDNRVQMHRAAKTAWAYDTSERVQMHRHVLWAMLQGPSTTRFRHMQRFFRQFVHERRNQSNVLESDSLNFLLRMECTFKFALQPQAPTQDSSPDRDAWLARVRTILTEMRALRYRTSYSSSHALFHFLMHRPDVALPSLCATDSATDDATPPPSTEDAIQTVLFDLLDTFPRPLERDARRMSLAVSTAACSGRRGIAVALLHDAEARALPLDAASFAHVVASATDEDKRLEIAQVYLRAKDTDRIYDGDDNHGMKNYLLHYAIFDGNFTQIMELLHEMEYNKVAATPATATALFASIARYRAKIRQQHADADASTLDKALQDCPTVQQLLTAFPSVLPRSAHAVSQAVLQALRAGDLDVALLVLRTTVWSSDVVVRAEIFSQLIYALLAAGADDDAVREAEKLFDAQHAGQRAHLGAQLLNLCESTSDLLTMRAVLDRWQAQRGATPLSRRAVQRVFDVVSKQLKALQQQQQQQDRRDGDSDDEEMDSVRFAVQGAELSFRATLERYPLLLPLNAWTLSGALLRSATAGLPLDVRTLLQVAHTKALVLEPAAYRVALEILLAAAEGNVGRDEARACEAELRACVDAMQQNGAWSVLAERQPDVTQRVQAAVTATDARS